MTLDLLPDRKYDRFMAEFKEVQERAHAHSVKAGFWDGHENNNTPTKQLLMIAEIVEAFEEWRGYREDRIENGKPEGPGFELADTVIRAMDYAEKHGIPLARFILIKMAYNETRPHMHGGKRV